ncbi:MAG: hypothetical protein ACO3UU_02940 [Minisyncoccia bacterium]|jgi:hypothetical protein
MRTQEEKDKLFEQALKIAKDKRLIFVEEVIAYLPISKPTFYDYYPKDSNDFNELKRVINDNKIDIKQGLREKWYESDNATLQMALYKLTAREEERKKLAMSYVDNTTKGEKINGIQVEIIRNKDDKLEADHSN